MKRQREIRALSRSIVTTFAGFSLMLLAPAALPQLVDEFRAAGPWEILKAPGPRAGSPIFRRDRASLAIQRGAYGRSTSV